MKGLLVIPLLLLIGCGQPRTIRPKVVQQNNVTVYDQSFEGVYYFDNGGYLEVIQGEDNELTVLREGQSLQSINPGSGNIASHPAVYYSGLEVINGMARFFANVRYSGATHDIEEDVSGLSIDGTRRTDFQLQMVGDHLELTIRIFGGPIGNDMNGVIATRVLRSI